MNTYKVEVDGEVLADNVGEAATKVAEHFLAVAEAWEAEEVDWDRVSESQTFSAPSRVDIRRI